jgi:Sec-independent protein translocase protein TatA
MISNFGPMELMVVAIIALLVLGPKRSSSEAQR